MYVSCDKPAPVHFHHFLFLFCAVFLSFTALSRTLSAHIQLSSLE